jgi:hypothetical protein
MRKRCFEPATTQCARVQVVAPGRPMERVVGREFGDFMRRLHEEVTSKSRTVLLIMTINPDGSLASIARR